LLYLQFVAEDYREVYGLCAEHEGVRAIASCPRCGRYMCPRCVSMGAEVSGELVCRACLGSLVAARGLRREVPWENRRGMSWLRAFFATWREVVFAPRAFFGGLEPAGGVFWPLIFAALCLAVGLLGGAWGAAETANALVGGAGGVAVAALAVGAAPAFYVVAFVATAAFLHIVARGFGGNAGFRATVRVVAYSQAAALAEILPAIGGILALVLRLSLYGWGLAAVHGLSAKRAIGLYAVLLVAVAGGVYFAAKLFAPFMALLG
jgi:hypothetical protein